MLALPCQQRKPFMKRAVLVAVFVLFPLFAFAQVQTNCTTNGTVNGSTVNADTNCTSNDVGASQRQAQQNAQQLGQNLGNAFASLIRRRAKLNQTSVVNAINAGFVQNHAVGYSEIAADELVIHSERASQMRFQMLLHNTEAMAIFKKVGLRSVTYTNDADFRQTASIE